MRALALVPDMFYGRGGIALYDADFLQALCGMPECTEVVALPRLSTDATPAPLRKLRYVDAALGGKARYVRAALATVVRGRFDLIVCGHVNLLPLAFMLRPFTRAPIVLLVYGIDVWAPTPSRLANALVRRVRHFVSISDVTRGKFVAWSGVPRERVTLLPNAVHLDRYGCGSKDAALLELYGLRSRTVIMTLGRMEASEQYKGFDEIIELMPALAQRFPDLVYMAIGDGSDRARLEAKAAQLGVGDRVIFTGFIAEGSKADHLRLADAFVMPSSGEGFGFVFLEAMACGVPVVASRTDGGREAVRHGALGILVDPTDRHSIERGIVEVLEKPRGVVPAGLDYFAYPAFERRVHEIVREALGRSAPAPQTLTAEEKR